jgi:hypothetical protein
MKPIFRNILSIPAGLILGSIINMALVMTGPFVFPPPEGADITTMEGLKATMHLFEPQNFLFPFLGHALGTLAGAIVAALIAASYRMRFSIAVSCFFLAGGIANVLMLGGPMWFNVLDVVVAYLPMGWLGGRVALRLSAPAPAQPA